jgi:hypothetical protein
MSINPTEIRGFGVVSGSDREMGAAEITTARQSMPGATAAETMLGRSDSGGRAAFESAAIYRPEIGFAIFREARAGAMAAPRYFERGRLNVSEAEIIAGSEHLRL